MDLTSLLFLAGASLVSVSLGVALVIYAQKPPSGTLHRAHNLYDGVTRGAVYIFDGMTMIDATPSAKALLAGSVERGGQWNRLIAFLGQYFTDIETKLLDLSNDGSLVLHADNPEKNFMQIQAEHRGGLLRVCLTDADRDQIYLSVDPLVHRATLEELSQLRRFVSKSPMLGWNENLQGEVIWANSAYLFATEHIIDKGQELGWPLPKFFHHEQPPKTGAALRASVTPSDGSEVKWYEVVCHNEKDGYLCFATPIDAVVHAEAAQREFTQSLAKTFAHLPIGLAIFDKKRRLQLFNPAFRNLTGLAVEMLTARPSILMVLDGLRERNMLPEPKDYQGWRRKLGDFERAAAAGLFEETWNLPDGQTFKVTGRPHPNGALALIIENVSHEIFRSRRYQADLDLSQSVIDHIDLGIVVFSQAGRAVVSNTSYQTLWGHDLNAGQSESIRHVCAFWRDRSAPSTAWLEIEDYVLTIGDRVAWSAQIRLLDGRLLTCKLSPLSGGSTMVLFAVGEGAASLSTVGSDGQTLKLA